MSTSSPAIHQLARRLLAAEPASPMSSQSGAHQIMEACGKLRGPLAKLTGTLGYVSLLGRALALAQRQAPALNQLRVEDDGALALSNGELRRDSDPLDPTAQGGLILLAELLSLLITLIGESLTLSLVREAWPDESIEPLTPKTEEKP